MPTGEFQNVQVSFVWIDRAKRQRREITDIDELAASIAARGLIHPILIRRDGELVAGERRYTAVKQLGWTNIPVQFTDELDPGELQLIELEENIKRVDLPWQEECDAVSRYHKIKQTADPKWTIDDTAAALNKSSRSLREQIEVQKAIDSKKIDPAKANNFTSARNFVRRAEERATAATLVKLEEALSETKPQVPLLNTEFGKWRRDYDGPPFNFIHCDFPYGIDFGTSARQNSNKIMFEQEYEDAPDVYFSLLNELAESMDKIVAPSAHLIFWFSFKYFNETLSALTKMGWTVNPFPLIWVKSDNSGILPDPSRGPRRVYETAFFASRGDRKIVQAVGNAIASPSTKEMHASEKPRPVLAHFFRMVCDEYTACLDPTAGSANAIRVARTLGATRLLGLEKDKHFYELAKEHFNDPN